MTMSNERLHEFMRIYEKEFGEKLSESEAKLIADRLMYFYERLARPLLSERKQDGEASRVDIGDFGDVG
jgi:hypothetical protein